MGVNNIINSGYLPRTQTFAQIQAADNGKPEEKSSWKKPVLYTALATIGMLGLLLLAYRSGLFPFQLSSPTPTPTTPPTPTAPTPTAPTTTTPKSTPAPTPQ